jgi:NADH dehydrogenase (ubiquinone) 1 beta subcomplex subunit 9
MATALQKARITGLYRSSLKELLSWVVSREVFYEEASKIRQEFEQNKHVSDGGEIERLLVKGEARLKDYEHPDPYIVPYRPGGSMFARNPPFVEGTSIHLDFGREGHH